MCDVLPWKDVRTNDRMEDNLPLASSEGRAPAKLFSRPDPSVLNTAIPVFFIGRNGDGLWVARNADAGSGGLFLLKGSAVRFAKNARLRFASAIIELAERFELDTANSGNRHADRLATLRRALARFGRALTRTTQAALTLALKPLRTIAGVLAEQRIHQVAVRLTTRR